MALVHPLTHAPGLLNIFRILICLKLIKWWIGFVQRSLEKDETPKRADTPKPR
jgi:hypothetical protein